MKKRTIIAITLTVLLLSASLLTALPISAAQTTASKWDGTYPAANLTATFSGGTGTVTDPYLLSTAADLAQMAANVNAFDAEGNYVGTNYDGVSFKLTADIDLDNKLWTPIGGGNATTSEPKNFFSGYFDGNFHTISNLYVKPEAKKDAHVGFFGYILKKSGTPGVSNLGIESGSVTGTARVGGLIGRAKGTMTIDNCYNKANVFVDSTANPLTGWTSAAGFIGQGDGTISFLDCYNTGNLTGTYISASTASIGGFIGYTTTGAGPAFNGCWNLGKVEIVAMSEGATAIVGGFSGYLKVASNVLNCYSVGEVKTSIFKGGYVGMLFGQQGNASTTVDSCHITASLNATGLGADRFIGGADANTFTAASGTNTVITADAAKLSLPHPDYNFLYIHDSMFVTT
ncbi:MAG: hypothetical protein IJZ80_07220, partial [Clostridia bacterium]|nr:hypothetical protein [Clostridia bacterium]